MPEWLEDAIFYEIYPQSFYDTNGDGIGDFEGIIQKLDYIRELGCNALWINPCFDSPFNDAGYDVRDYKKAAQRYGTNEDMFRLFGEAHRRGIRVLLDLVPGHTSEEHSWFKASRQEHPSPEFKNRYIWTDNWFTWGNDGFKVIAGEAERDGCYVINFFKSQPALNYGVLNPQEPWQLPVDHPDCIATREAMKDVMRFWLRGDGSGRGCDGFRVDMADSLVKCDDGQKSGTSAIWQDIRRMLDSEFPEAALVSEWSNPPVALGAGFHMDFLLDHWKSGYKSLVREYSHDKYNGAILNNRSFFKKDAGGDICRFLDQYLQWYEASKRKGYISLITGNHDTLRISADFSPRELCLAYSMIFSMPGVPFLYYGDEIGMRYIHCIPTKEGGYTRTGSRTPMQWNSGVNLGFSAAPAEKLYLPVDSDPDAPTVEAQEQDPGSILNTVKAILRLRHAEADLRAGAGFEVLYAEKEHLPFVYRRGSLVLALNPSGAANSVKLNIAGKPSSVYRIGDAQLVGGNGDHCLSCDMPAQSFGVWRV